MPLRCWLCALLLVAGCDGADLTLAVELRTDMVPGAEFDGVAVDVEGVGRDEAIARAGEDYTSGLRVTELDGLSSGTYRATVSLVSNGVVVVQRPLIVTLSSSQVATVVVTRSCQNVSCPRSGDAPEALACLGGRCVVPECTPETPDACPAPDCTTDTECGPAAACAVARCRDGVCFEEDDDSCGATAYCDVASASCLALPGADAGVDAGMLDAGLLDAGSIDAGFDAGRGPPVPLGMTGVDLRDLIAYWPFDVASAVDDDTFPAENTPDIVATLQTGDMRDVVAPGVVGNALDLDGVDDLLSAPDNVALDLTGPHTLTAWVSMDTLPVAVDYGIVGKAEAYTLEIEADTDCIDYAVFFPGMGFDELDPMGCGLTAGDWHHLAAVFDGTEMLVYQDGALVDTLTYSQPSVRANDAPLYIGFNNTAARYLDGQIDEVTIWGRALEPSEIQTLFTRQSPP